MGFGHCRQPFKIKIDGKLVHAVVVLTKTGDVIYLDAASGNPIFQNSFKKVRVPISDVQMRGQLNIKKIY